MILDFRDNQTIFLNTLQELLPSIYRKKFVTVCSKRIIFNSKIWKLKCIIFIKMTSTQQQISITMNEYYTIVTIKFKTFGKIKLDLDAQVLSLTSDSGRPEGDQQFSRKANLRSK